MGGKERISLSFVILFLSGCSQVDQPTQQSSIPDNSATVSVLPASKTTASSTLPLTEEQTVAEAPNARPENRATSQSHSIRFPFFAEASAQSGIHFTYTNGAIGKVLMVEATGGGAGWLDFDGDGLLDLYLCQGGNPATDQPDQEPCDAIFRQTLPGHFERISELAGVCERGYSQGVSVSDFDDDGFDDVYVTNVGPNTFWRNQGDGTFLEISAAAGVANPLWSSSSAWGDLDSDGDLDLYVCNYVDYDPYHPIPCGSDGKPGTCHPMHVKAVPDECYMNQGDGTFTAEAHARGLFGPDNKALGVVIADLNNDGLNDVYVANDTTVNFLFVNQGSGQFVESASILGGGVSREGLPQASMGVAIGDYDQNGWLDLYCTHFTKESNTLYKNLGATGFQDVTGLVGLHTPTLKFLGFGTTMNDFDQDGHEDIFVTNGHVDDWRSKGDRYLMEPQLFSFQNPRFVECSAQAGEFFQTKSIGRAVARGDFDQDGDWDLAVVHQNSPTAILRNDSVRGNWLKLRCRATGNRRGIGTRVTLRQGTKTLMQELVGGSSYCAAHEAALIFGLGDADQPCSLDIRWPDGMRQTINDIQVNQELVLVQDREKHETPKTVDRTVFTHQVVSRLVGERVLAAVSTEGPGKVINP